MTITYSTRISSSFSKRIRYLILNGHLDQRYLTTRVRMLLLEVINEAEKRADLRLTPRDEAGIRFNIPIKPKEPNTPSLKKIISNSEEKEGLGEFVEGV